MEKHVEWGNQYITKAMSWKVVQKYVGKGDEERNMKNVFDWFKWRKGKIVYMELQSIFEKESNER